MICGKVLMDQNAPRKLLDTPEQSYRDSKQLIEKWHNKDRLLYAVTPRFAITSSKEQMKMAGKLLQEFPGLYLQTHLAEGLDEIAAVKKLYPEQRSYLDIYHDFGLTGRKSVFAHCIHLDDDDFKQLKATGSNISFCPTSNLFLGNDAFCLHQAKEHGVTVGAGTDLGAGTSFSMFQTLNEAYKVTSMARPCGGKRHLLGPFEALYMATLEVPGPLI